MIEEFGSDFHLCHTASNRNTVTSFFPKASFFGNGRNAIESVLKMGKWKRIWIPRYFCYGVINAIRNYHIEVCFYEDSPLFHNDSDIIARLPFEDGDVLFRMNYFGTRSWRDNSNIPVPVIEDHSHDLISGWAMNSNADWCIASLRKTIPIAGGGIVWSPKHYQLPNTSITDDCRSFADMRYQAMKMKKWYLEGKDINKSDFRELYLESEEMLDNLKYTAIDERSMSILSSFDIDEWTQKRYDNWNLCNELLKEVIDILPLEDSNNCHPFSMLLICKNSIQRTEIRKKMIENCIFPAILWQIPEEESSQETRAFSEKMISVHCDGRYNQKNIIHLCTIISSIISNDSAIQY